MPDKSPSLLPLSFYQDLPLQTLPLYSLLGKEQLFSDVPNDWQVIVIDIMGSTQAVAAGRHHDVNLVATGGIITVLNLLKTNYEGVRVPYFFGGDGATFLVPGATAEELVQALDNYRRHVSRQFDLVLRVGALPVAAVYAAGNSIRIANFQLNKLLHIPVVLGNGLKIAETRIKAGFVDPEALAADLAPIDLTGMECRWNEIEPPRDEERIICLIVSSPDDRLQGRLYGEVLARVEQIFGALAQRQPVSTNRLRLNLGLVKTAREMYATLGRFNLKYLLQSWIATLYGPYWFKRTESGKNYLNKLTQLTDTLMLDGNINTIFSGTSAQIKQLTTYLDQREATGELRYGMHVTGASVMSCYVLDHDEDHVHFVDGTEGGYTAAARMFKRKGRDART